MTFKKPGTKKEDPNAIDKDALRFGKTGEIDYETTHLQVALGKLTSLGVAR